MEEYVALGAMNKLFGNEILRKSWKLYEQAAAVKQGWHLNVPD